MNEEEYIESRLDDQIDWYDRKSLWNQKWYKRLQIVVLIAAATIPFLTAYSDEVAWIKFVIGILGLAIAAITAILGLYAFQENWIKYRTVCESLKKEKYKYLTRIAPYDNERAFALLVEQVEGLISKENTEWSRKLENASEKSGQ